jgi:hypothetical protein
MNENKAQCPYCEDVIENYDKYERKAPPDKDIEREEMVVVYPCSHAFPLNLFKDYLHSVEKKQEYVEEYVTARGDIERSNVTDRYKEDLKEHQENTDACRAEVEFYKPVMSEKA